MEHDPKHIILALGVIQRHLMFANISPVPSSVNESLCSLRFAAKVNSCEIGVPRRQTHIRPSDARLSMVEKVRSYPDPNPNPSSTHEEEPEEEPVHASIIVMQMNDVKIPAAKEMRHIDRKLKCCWNPSLQEGSKRREKKSKHKTKRTAAEMQGAR
ncbi:uncharacterized protein LOC116257968 [Nymphaea colorata]|nr:uncharacterized protein LOC116257968 [Nymphaea colorata]